MKDAVMNMPHDHEGVLGFALRDGKVQDTDAPRAAVLFQVIQPGTEPGDLQVFITNDLFQLSVFLDGGGKQIFQLIESGAEGGNGPIHLLHFFGKVRADTSSGGGR